MNSLAIYETLTAAKIEEPQARAIAKAIAQAVEERESGLKEDMAKTLATKQDLAELESRVTTRFFTALLAQSGILLGAMYFLMKLKP